jgi:2-methylcitrate dehydratase PrpD
VADKEFSWVHASEAKIKDPVIHALIDKIKVGEPITQEVERYQHGARVTIHTKDGKSHVSTVYAPRGSGATGIQWADVEKKFHTLVPMAGMNKASIEQALAILHAFRDQQNVSALIGLLRKG